jgi:acetyl-CoA carboxylase biotin carboxyl carrier protein
MATKVRTEITGMVRRIEKQIGDVVQAGEVLVILESMKMELPVEAPAAGTISEIRCKEGQSVSEGDILIMLS